MFSVGGGAASRVFSKIHGAAADVTEKMSPGFVGSVGRTITDYAGTSPAAMGMVYGGIAGAAGGVLSSDKDMHWYTGAAQGAFAGAQIATHGLSGMGVGGAAAGAIYGMLSDDTSIMGGAFMGASLGAARRYSKAPGLAAKRAARLGKAHRSPNLGKIGGRPIHGPKRAPTRRGQKKTPGFARKTGFGANAIYNAMKRDVGFGWRGGGRKASKVGTNSIGKAGKQGLAGAAARRDPKYAGIFYG